MEKKLKKLTGFSGVKGPVVTIVMDGVGLTAPTEGNAVAGANTPTLDMLMEKYPCLKLKAHGTAVGLPTDDDMGNSEVGHNAIGAGQVFSQGAKLVSESIESGKMFESETWNKLVANVKENGSTLHFLGLFSDGNVHSHIDHLRAMINRAKADGVGKVRIHILLDGRDVGETSALDYVLPFEDYIGSLRDDNFDIMIASGGGRMKITMDRYEADWSMVERGWKTHVLGEGRQFASAEEAITTYRNEYKVIDQDLPPFVIAKDAEPVGAVKDGDSVIFFNFRGDRAIEISKTFDDPKFDKFDRVRYRPDGYICDLIRVDVSVRSLVGAQVFEPNKFKLVRAGGKLIHPDNYSFDKVYVSYPKPYEEVIIDGDEVTFYEYPFELYLRPDGTAEYSFFYFCDEGDEFYGFIYEGENDSFEKGIEIK